MPVVRARRNNLYPVSVAANSLGQIAPFSSGPKVTPGMASVPQEPCRGLSSGPLSPPGPKEDYTDIKNLFAGAPRPRRKDFVALIEGWPVETKLVGSQHLRVMRRQNSSRQSTPLRTSPDHSLSVRGILPT